MNSGIKRSNQKYRATPTDPTSPPVIAFSVSYERENMLPRGMGLEHLRELLIRLASPMLRQQVVLAYGGSWKEREDNFTYELLRLISAEQQDNSMSGPDTSKDIKKLYNHSSWPNYLSISRQIEAQWINCCQIIRISQQDAAIAAADVVPDVDAWYKSPRTILNTALTLSAMRRRMMERMTVTVPDLHRSETIHPVRARIVLGGKVDSYSGFLPGIFEEALVTLENECPTYILGGFGGAAELLANAILAAGPDLPDALTLEGIKRRNGRLEKLLDAFRTFNPQPGLTPTEQLLDKLFERVTAARAKPSDALNTGLTEDDTRELLKTQDIATAVRLVRTGLEKKGLLNPVHAA